MELMTPARVYRAQKHHEGPITVGRPDPAYEAYEVLYFCYVVLPIIVGIDKFFHVFTNWNQYLSSTAISVVGNGPEFMKIVGIVEIVTGILVAVVPRIGAAIVTLWLLAIVANLLCIPGYFDIALRDIGLALGAFAFWRLSKEYASGS